jgi:hypothetical protein
VAPAFDLKNYIDSAKDEATSAKEISTPAFDLKNSIREILFRFLH